MLLCSNFTLFEFNPFGDATFNIDILMLLLCLCCSMTLVLNFQVVFWTCFQSLPLCVFQSYKTFPCWGCNANTTFLSTLFNWRCWVSFRGVEWMKWLKTLMKIRSSLLMKTLFRWSLSRCYPFNGNDDVVVLCKTFLVRLLSSEILKVRSFVDDVSSQEDSSRTSYTNRCCHYWTHLYVWNKRNQLKILWFQEDFARTFFCWRV